MSLYYLNTVEPIDLFRLDAFEALTSAFKGKAEIVLGQILGSYKFY